MVGGWRLGEFKLHDKKNLDFLEQTVRRNIIIRDIVENSEGNK